MTIFMLKYSRIPNVYRVVDMERWRCKVVYSIALLILLCSCTTTKNIQKSKTDEKTEIKTVETTTTTTVIQGTLETKADSIEASEPIIDLENGKDLVIEDSKVKTTVHFDKKTGKVSEKTVEKAISIPVSTTLTAITTKMVTEKKEVKTSDFSKVKKTSYLSWWWLALLLIPVWIFRKRIFSRVLRR